MNKANRQNLRSEFSTTAHSSRKCNKTSRHKTREKREISVNKANRKNLPPEFSTTAHSSRSVTRQVDTKQGKRERSV